MSLDDVGGTPTRGSPKPPPQDKIPLFPLDVVLFPGELFGLHIFEERYVLMTEEVLAENLPIGIVLARQDQPDDLVEFEPEEVGTLAYVIASQKTGEGRYLLQTVGTRRFRIRKVLSEKPYQEALVEWLDELPGDEAHALELAEGVLARVEELGGQVDRDDQGAEDPIAISHAVAAALPVDLETKYRLLEAADAEARLDAEAEILEAVA